MSLLVLAGWAADFQLLVRGFPGAEPLFPAAPLCFLLLSLALHNHNQDPAVGRRKVLLAITALLPPVLAMWDHGGFGASIRPAWFFGADPATPYLWGGLSSLGVAAALAPIVVRRRFWWGDVLGAMVLLLILVHGFFLFAALRSHAVISGIENKAFFPFWGGINALLLGFAVLGRLGPGQFPLRILAGPSVRAVILRRFLSALGASLLIFKLLLEFGDYGHLPPPLGSFLILLFSLVLVTGLSVFSAEGITRRIEVFVKESEERYSVLVESLKAHAVLLLDSEGRILTWNTGAEKILGYDAGEVLGDRIARFYRREDREAGRMESVFKGAILKGVHEENGWRVRKDGSLLWAETMTRPFINKKEGLLGFSHVLQDITPRKKYEEMAREREVFMQLLQEVTAACNATESLDEASPVVLRLVCSRTGWPVGHAWFTFPGMDEFISGHWYLKDEERFAPFRAHSDRLRFPRDKGLPAQVLASGKAQWTPDLLADKEFPHGQEVAAAGLAAGYAFPVVLSGKVISILVFFSEKTGAPSIPCREALEAICVQLERVAERERAERSLRVSERRYRSLTQTANDAIVSYDGAGIITGWNRGAKAIFGLDAGDVIGMFLGRIVHDPASSGAAPADFPRTLLSDMASTVRELVGVRKDGEVFPIEVTVADWRSAGAMFFTAIMRDVTGHKKAQESLTASLREKESLLKEVHHRVKNNLQMISSLLRLQSEKIQDPALLGVFMESQNRVKSMAILHECLYESADLAHMDFSEYVKKLTDNLLRTYSAHPEKHRLLLRVDSVSLSLDVAIPCGLIITELVSNALKYAYPEGVGGDISVSFKAMPENHYELIVADQGVGLKNTVDFHSTDSLGLRLVRMLSEQLRGSIQMEGGSGAKFTMVF